MLQIINVNKKYIINDEVEFELGPLNIEIKNRGIVFLMGSSGCGKTTLLNILGCVENDYSGSFLFEDCNVTGIDEKADFRNANIGYIFQDYNLFEERTVLENILISNSLQGKKNDISEVRNLLMKLDIADKIKTKVKNLSGGQKQRVAIARALIKKPKLLLCDEPTGALDEKTGQEIFELLRKFSNDCLVIIASHDNKSAEMFADRIIKMDDGQIVQDIVLHNNTNTKCKRANKVNKCSKTLVLKEGTVSIFKRPIFLLLSLIVGSLSLGVFGLSFTIRENPQNDLIMDYVNSNQIPYLSYRKEIKACDLYGDEFTITDNFKNQSDFINIANRSSNFSYVYNDFRSISSFLSFSYGALTVDEKLFQIASEIKGYCEITETFLHDFNFTLIDGRLPTNNDEIVITKHIYNCFYVDGYKQDGIKIKNPSISDLLEKDIEIKDITKSGFRKFKIVGVIDTKTPKEYDLCSYKKNQQTQYDDF